MKTKFKNIMLGVGFALLGNYAATAQSGLQGIIVEKYYQSNAADALNASNNGGTLNIGSNTYRVFVDLAPGWKFVQAFGNANHAWKITTTTTFFNSPTADAIIGAQATGTAQVRQHTRMIDSYLTTGAAANGQAGVLKIEDPNGSIGNANGVLTNNPGGLFGAPINSVNPGAQDGMAPGGAGSPGSIVAPNALGLGTQADIFDFNQSPGGTFSVTNGAVAALGGVVGTTTTNAVLIGQFTTDGVLGFELNIQVQNTLSLVSEVWVANNPQSGEFVHAGLTLAPPTVTVTSPLNGANIITGTQMTLTANAVDNGTVTQVQFLVDGTPVGTDLTAPFSATYNATVGSHTVTAIATDNDALTATSAPVVFTAANNQAPVVSVVAPSGAKVGDVITFTASASDVDGTVASVTFSVDNVAIGTDATSPYNYTWTATLGAHSVKASALDNLALAGISTPVAFNVVANLPPAAAITSPTNNTSYVTVTPSLVTTTISAVATDVDGTVTSVEFFVNSLSIGTDNTAPFSMVWTASSFGPANITAMATDNNGATATSSLVTVNIVNANALPYEIGAVKQQCNQGIFSLPISVASTYTVDNVIGYDFVLNYNAAKVTPTGSITVNPALITPSYVTVVNAFGGGTMNVSAYFNGNAPGNAKWNGSAAELFSINFVKNTMSEVDTAVYSISSLDESYFIGTQSKTASNGRYTTYRDTTFNAKLRHANTGVPVAFNSLNPNDYLVTNIYGSSSSCVTNTVGPVQPDLTGSFVYNVLKGNWINIVRDIMPSTSVQLPINGNDVFVGRQVLLNTTSVTPSVFQIIALDVNLDGLVSSGDISQINQRSTLAIPEFKQAWNYNAAGTNTLGQPSKDYTFVDSLSIQNDPAYSISTTYPLNNNIGYSKFKVPSTPFCLPVPISSVATCPTINDAVFKAVMLGDADQNVASLTSTPGTQYRPSGDKIVIDLEKSIVNGNTVEVPVMFVSSSPVVALDFAAKFDESNLTYNAMVNIPSTSDAFAHMNTNDKTLRFTTTNSDLSAFNAGQSVASIRFESKNGNVDASQFNSLLGIINGVSVPVEVHSKTVGISPVNADNSTSIYPNPSNGILNVTSIGDATVELFDVTGNQVLLQTSVSASKTKQIDVSNLSNGVYMVKISNSDFVTIKKVVLNK